MPRLLLIDDDTTILPQQIRLTFPGPTYEVHVATTGEHGLKLFREATPDVVLLDLRLPDRSGMELYNELRSIDRRVPVVFITMTKGADDAIEAMKLGAFDYLFKPVDLKHLQRIVKDALEVSHRMRTPVVVSDPGVEADVDGAIVGSSPQMREVYKSIGRVSAQDVPVLITGESGTGKELIARAIYQHGPRAGSPFLVLNCAAIPEQLLESELFGHEKGAFTGADRRRIGKFEQVNGGTLFLDEIGDMPLALQAKMLRAIEERRFERVGGNAPLQVDVRVVAATNRHLKQMVAARRFREDLYFRLSVFPIVVPPLRERPTDIPLLAQHFIERFGRDLKKRVTLTPAAIEHLCAYSWPGNIRELQNCLERALILAEGETIQPMHLQLQTISERAASEDTSRDVVTALAANPYAAFDWSGPLADVSRRALNEAEKYRIRQALDEAAGDRARAAEALQVPMRFLQAKIKDFGL